MGMRMILRADAALQFLRVSVPLRAAEMRLESMYRIHKN